ncbi:hypothetical protein GEV33_009096 [Tenebrio molitor]|uniref:Uncharacterized protein n=1 Tax=Tenebrio molitor TaxID=7067 RepID=A0A8J6HFG6_TENMO|nr:hypothetical protein GEV33_009096 [Tenebrio molitor]
MSRASESAERLKQNRDANVVTVPSIVAKRLARHFTFGRGFPTPSHRGMSHITDKANAGSVPLSTYHLPSSPILTVRIANLPVSLAENALENLSSPRSSSGGNERCKYNVLYNITPNIFALSIFMEFQEAQESKRVLWKTPLLSLASRSCVYMSVVIR